MGSCSELGCELKMENVFDAGGGGGGGEDRGVYWISYGSDLKMGW